MIRIGLAGTVDMVTRYIHAMATLPSMRCVGVVAPHRPEIPWRIPIYPTMPTLAAHTTPDLIVIAPPYHQNHAEIAELIRHHSDVALFPPWMDTPDLTMMGSVAAARGRVVIIAMPDRGGTELVWWRDALDERLVSLDTINTIQIDSGECGTPPSRIEDRCCTAMSILGGIIPLTTVTSVTVAPSPADQVLVQLVWPTHHHLRTIRLRLHPAGASWQTTITAHNQTMRIILTHTHPSVSVYRHDRLEYGLQPNPTDEQIQRDQSLMRSIALLHQARMSNLAEGMMIRTWVTTMMHQIPVAHLQHRHP